MGTCKGKKHSMQVSFWNERIKYALKNGLAQFSHGLSFYKDCVIFDTTISHLGIVFNFVTSIVRNDHFQIIRIQKSQKIISRHFQTNCFWLTDWTGPNTVSVNLTYQAAVWTWIIYETAMTSAVFAPALPKALIAMARAMERLRITVQERDDSLHCIKHDERGPQLTAKRLGPFFFKLLQKGSHKYRFPLFMVSFL